MDLIPVSSIVLNPKNYRHRPVASEQECIAALMLDDAARSQLLALARDIVDRGLNPTDLAIVEPHGKYWRVQEGNRRICALKILANPQVIPDLPGLTKRSMDLLRRQWSTLAATGTGPSKVDCWVTADRAAIDHWVSLKHTGPGTHHGAGTIMWDAEGRTRSEQASVATGGTGRAANQQAALALSLLDELARLFPQDEAMQTAILKARKSGITTLGRLVLRQEARLRLGLHENSQQITAAVTAEALHRTFTRVLSELGSTDLNSRTIHNKEQVDGYLDRITKDLPKAKDRLAPGSAPEPSSKSEQSGGRPHRTKTDPIATSPYKGLQLASASSKTRQILGELQKFKFDSSPNTCVVMNRLLLDCFLNDAMDYIGGKAEEIQPRATRALRQLDGGDVKTDKSRFPHVHAALSSGSGYLSIKTMHAWVHRHDFQADANAARTQCEHLRPFLEALDKAVQDHRQTAKP